MAKRICFEQSTNRKGNVLLFGNWKKLFEDPYMKFSTSNTVRGSRRGQFFAVYLAHKYRCRTSGGICVDSTTQEKADNRPFFTP